MRKTLPISGENRQAVYGDFIQYGVRLKRKSRLQSQ